MKYKVGDRVKCIDASNTYLEYGKVYEVSDAFSGDYDDYVNLVNVAASGWSTSRFELVKEEVSMHKFKVGDVVKIVGAVDGKHKKLDNTDGFNNIWANFMDKFIGKVCTVKGITKTGIDLTECNDYRFPPQALELFTEKMKIQKDKKYRTVATHYPVRIICKDRKDSKLPWVALYTASSGGEGVIYVNQEGADGWGKKIIEEVPEIDWSKVKIDTPIWVKQHQGWIKHHFAKFNKEYNNVCYWDERRTSHTAGHEFEYSSIHSNYVALTNPDEKA